MIAHRTVLDYLRSISNPKLRDQYVALHEANPFYNSVCAGAQHHHWWLGGLADHVGEMIEFCLEMLHWQGADLRNITEDDIIIACYLHDFAKIWTYTPLTDFERGANPEKYFPRQQFMRRPGVSFDIVDEESQTLLYLARNGIIPTEQQWSAVLFAEGGWSAANFDYGRTRSEERRVGKGCKC